MSFRVATLVVLLLTAPVAAQCSNISAIAFTEYGAGCSAYGQDPPALSGTYSAVNCTVTLNLSGWPGNCPGICLSQRVLAVGSAPAQVPLSFVPCDLLVVPDLILVFAPAAGDTFVFAVPNAPLAGATFYVQGAQDFQQGSIHQFEVSNGLQISIL
jgi:hypothetical protein